MMPNQRGEIAMVNICKLMCSAQASCIDVYIKVWLNQDADLSRPLFSLFFFF